MMRENMDNLQEFWTVFLGFHDDYFIVNDETAKTLQTAHEQIPVHWWTGRLRPTRHRFVDLYGQTWVIRLDYLAYMYCSTPEGRTLDHKHGNMLKEEHPFGD